MKLRRDISQEFPIDEIYANLISLGIDKNDRDARQAVAALVLLLINHIGDKSIIEEAIAIVRKLPSTDRPAT